MMENIGKGRKMILTTTFELLKKEKACEDGYRKLAKTLGGIGKYGRTTPINLLDILESNGVDDMLWSLRATEQDCESLSRHMACDFAAEVLPIYEKHHPDDSRVRDCIETARKYAAGQATDAEREAARAAAERDAAGAAREAAWDAAWDARAAAWEAWDAAWEAWDAAAAARAAASAARAAASAARAAAGAARAAAWDARAAAGEATGAKQKEIIETYLST